MGVLMPSSEWQLDYYSHWIYHYLSSLTAMTGSTKISRDFLKSFFFGLMRLNWCIFPPFVQNSFTGQHFRLQGTNKTYAGAVAALTGQKSHTSGWKLDLWGNYATSAALSSAHVGYVIISKPAYFNAYFSVSDVLYSHKVHANSAG